MELETIPSDILTRPCRDFAKREKSELVNLAYEMAKLMMEKNGIGIAGPQVGINERIFIVSPVVLGDFCDHTVFINPEITWRSIEDGTLEEGCLSVPGQQFEVPRPQEISISATNIHGERFNLNKVGGLLGRVLQHEYDHTMGLLINRFNPGG